jgi:hypothetical protein
MTTTFDAAALRAELSALQRARWGGALTVSYMAQGITRTVTYKRDSEMATAITDLEGKLAGAEGRLVPREFLVYSSKGW